MNQNQEILETLQTSFIKKEGYFKNNQWNKSRCRIDATLFTDIMLDYFLTNKESNEINEYYLTKTRLINKNRRNYKNSHGMDISALKQLLKFSNKTKIIKNKLEKYSYEDVKFTLDKYIDNVLNNLEVIKYKDVLNEWNTYYQSLFNNSDEKIEKEIENILKNKELNLLNKEDLISNFKDFEREKEFNSSIVESKNIEKLGYCGEGLVYHNLIKTYGQENVKWVSKINKYQTHDFQITINNQIKYIEVKSTTSSDLKHFFISRNEYEFYKQNKKNYSLYFVSNIKLFDTKNIYSPNLLIIDSPKIEIDLNKSGIDYDKDQVIITPNNFIAIW